MAAAPREANAGKGKEAKPAEDAAPKKKKGKLPLVIAAVVVLLAVAGGAGWFLMKPKADDNVAEGKDAKEAKSEAPTKPPVFLPLDTFTVNLRDQGTERYLQTAITLEFPDSEAEARVKAHLPIARSRILLLLSAKEAQDLHKVEDKTRLATEIVAELSKLPALKDVKVNAVHFSAFVIQ